MGKQRPLNLGQMLWARLIRQNGMLWGGAPCSFLRLIAPDWVTLLLLCYTRTFCEIAFRPAPVETTSTSPFQHQAPNLCFRSSSLHPHDRVNLRVPSATSRNCPSPSLFIRDPNHTNEPSCRRQLYVRTSRHVSPIIDPMYIFEPLHDRSSRNHPIATLEVHC